jgi:apolipoprotein N-acyltransferase
VLPRLFRHLAGRAGWRALTIAFGLGALAAAALPPVHAVPVLLVAIPGLLVMAAAAPTPRRAALIGLAWGWGHHLAGVYWVTHAILTEVERFWWLVPIAAPALALPLGAFSVLPAVAAKLSPPGLPRALLFAAAWVAAEMLRGVVFTGFPWNLIGTVWAFGALPVQAAAWIGVHGLSLATVLLALLPLAGWRGLLPGVAALAASGLLGLARLWPEEPAPQRVMLVLVQGNVAQEVKWSEESRIPIFRRYIELTREGVAEAEARLPQTFPSGGARIVAVWPETASPFWLANDAEAARIATSALPPGAMLLSGTVRAELGADGRLARVFNSLAAVDAEGRVLDAYDKSHLVPFGEYMPLRGLLPLRVVRSGLDFTAGPGLRAMAPGGLPPFSTLVCYEVIFPGAVTPPAAADRPEWLLNVTNDAWFGISAGPHQHLAAARLRAVEEGLPLARAAQTGISAVFDARGREVARSRLGSTGVIVAPLPSAAPPTVFARFGQGSPLVLLALVTGLGVFLARRGRSSSSSDAARPRAQPEV